MHTEGILNTIQIVKQMNDPHLDDDFHRFLVEYIKALHDNFKVTHGDLFLRNIMVDDTGSFYVIDFGKAKVEQIGEDHEARRSVDIATITSEIGKFFQELDKLSLE